MRKKTNRRRLNLPHHSTRQNTKQKVVSMETQYKLASRSAQLLVKDAPQEEAARVMAAMATAKGQLSKVGEEGPETRRHQTDRQKHVWWTAGEP